MASDNTLTDGHFRVLDEVALPTGPTVVRARATRSDEYPIIVTTSLADTLDRLVEILDGAKVALITDETVRELYGNQVEAELTQRGTTCRTFALPPGETSKSVAQACRLWDWLAESDISRRDFIVTLGGGVINDLGGWVASAYMRGLPYINLPTTLLAQVDGAMGGKVAANHPTAKNLIGAFHQPTAVISNVAFLETLDRRHLAAGLAESIKKAIIASPDYWDLIDQTADRMLENDLDALEQLVRGAATIKTLLVERDPYEDDLRRPLNFGHTIGHPLETLAGYGTLLHGEAVAFGMVVETQIAANRGLLTEPPDEWLPDLLQRVGLPHHGDDLPAGLCLEALTAAMAPVYRIRARSFLYVLPERRGLTLIAGDVTPAELDVAATSVGLRSARSG